MAQLDAVFPQFIAGSRIGRDSENVGQNESYFRIETPPSGNDTVAEYVNGIMVHGRLSANDLIATDWSVIT